jgi:hypothetical protein
MEFVMTVSWLEIGVVVSLGVGVVALILALVALVYARRQLQQAQELLTQIKRDLALANNGSVGMGQRLLAMEKRLREAPETTNAGAPDYSDDDEFQSYTQAAQLFKLGFDSEEVARRCGLSRAEATLMEMMQKATQ